MEGHERGPKWDSWSEEPSGEESPERHFESEDYDVPRPKPSPENRHNQFPEWVTESERIYLDHNFEDDAQYLAMHERISQRFDQELKDRTLSGVQFEKVQRRIEEEEFERRVLNNPEKAAEWTELWESFCQSAGIDPGLSDDEWHKWRESQRGGFDMSDYRSVARMYTAHFR